MLGGQRGIGGDNPGCVLASLFVLWTGSHGNRGLSAAFSVPSGCAAFVDTRVTGSRSVLELGGVAGIHRCSLHTA